MSIVADTSFSYSTLTIDAAGDLAVGGTARTSGGSQVVAYRGNVRKGLGAQEVIDSATDSTPILQSMSMGTGGQILMVWDKGTRNAAWAPGPRAAWVTSVVDERASSSPEGYIVGVVTDAGVGIVYDFHDGVVVRGSATSWGSAQALPSGYPVDAFSIPAVARNGCLLWVAYAATGGYSSDNGLWATYDAITNETVHAIDKTSPGSGFVLGVNTTNESVGYAPLLSTSGIGAVVMANTFKKLPSGTTPGGVRGTSENLWAAFLR